MQASSKPVVTATAEGNVARNESRGMWLGLIGVAVFSLTLPFTRIAVAELSPAFVAFGRAVVAGLCSLALLAWMRAPRPNAQQLRGLVITALGVVVGFPLFSSIAMRYVPAAHGAVVVGLLPLATALFGALRFGERPSAGFWLSALAGSAIVIAFALRAGGGSFHAADFALFAAVITAAMGYAEGGRLAQSMGGQNVIAWALVVALPVMLPVSLWLGWQDGLSASAPAWLAFGYVSLFSMFIGFFFWYKGLALGGIARVGQVQLLQPFMSLLGAAVIAGEALDASNMLFALAVIVVVAIGRRMAVRR
ncbi:DMT family transporter [Herbaspirillum seropedicae]|uniref:Permease of the drug/metabolite transporter (DMT) superfamily protein n=1 Tax=Herbaspirillum seropedicae (strain SmR1) TaxID=757424 RepID=D8IRJ7_HERSS|nr:DMT family transporter [Herbaspirillum seropedicae]ADJ63321.1 permease of the drug/metabolite transporter (DMT) superfamily protein [Herbaspirillum seropedicae SmR1]AKN65359.1 multidrug DMT transporter permease [Herbaspirillum seropedicae]NQE28522.1 multidrug DMT transporter permease [Herbaspirillum seropedicae]UMU21328.1 DMT family transporter [Herbaspirillum seropedicae]